MYQSTTLSNETRGVTEKENQNLTKKGGTDRTNGPPRLSKIVLLRSQDYSSIS
jgi:hypothetical protein